MVIKSFLNNLTLISGGQTGADRAALDFSIEHNIPHQGYCPKGRLAEDGRLDKKYNLTETPSNRYEQRTEWNVKHSDGTVIFCLEKDLTGGTLYTKDYAIKKKKPALVITKQTNNPQKKLKDFIITNNISKLNVAGPRASKEPLVYDFVIKILSLAFL